METNDYFQGRMAAFHIMLTTILRELPAAESSHARLLAERTETLLLLRDICETYGDNDWPDDAHLTDVIEKHLIRNIACTLEKLEERLCASHRR